MSLSKTTSSCPFQTFNCCQRLLFCRTLVGWFNDCILVRKGGGVCEAENPVNVWASRDQYPPQHSRKYMLSRLQQHVGRREGRRQGRREGGREGDGQSELDEVRSMVWDHSHHLLLQGWSVACWPCLTFNPLTPPRQWVNRPDMNWFTLKSGNPLTSFPSFRDCQGKRFNFISKPPVVSLSQFDGCISSRLYWMMQVINGNAWLKETFNRWAHLELDSLSIIPKGKALCHPEGVSVTWLKQTVTRNRFPINSHTVKFTLNFSTRRRRPSRPELAGAEKRAAWPC